MNESIVQETEVTPALPSGERFLVIVRFEGCGPGVSVVGGIFLTREDAQEYITENGNDVDLYWILEGLHQPILKKEAKQYQRASGET